MPIINQFKYNLIILAIKISMKGNYKMYDYESEIRALQKEVDDCMTIIEKKDIQIQELQNKMHDSVSAEEFEKLHELYSQKANQCSSFEEELQEKDELIHNLQILLKQNDAEINALTNKSNSIELLLATQDKGIEKMQNQKKNLQANDAKLRSDLKKKDQRITIYLNEISHQAQVSKEMEAQNTNLKNSMKQKVKQIQILQKINQQNLTLIEQKDQKLKVMQTNMNQMLNEMKTKEADCSNLKNVLNSCDWKEFCIQTELDLAKKELNQKNCILDKYEQKCVAFQSDLKEKELIIQNLIHEIYVLETNLKSSQLQRSKLEDDYYGHSQKLLQLTSISEELEENMKNRDSEINILQNCISELRSQLESVALLSNEKLQEIERLKERIMNLQNQSYELEQKLQEKQSKIDQQIEQIQYLERNIEYLTQKYENQNEIEISKKDELLKESKSRINELTIEVIEKEIQITKRIQEIQSKSLQIKKIKCNLKNSIAFNYDLQVQLDSLRNTLQIKERMIKDQQTQNNQLFNKITMMQVSLKQKQKLIQILQSQVRFEKRENIIQKSNNELREEQIQKLLQERQKFTDQIAALSTELQSCIQMKLNSQIQIKELKDMLEMTKTQNCNQSKEIIIYTDLLKEKSHEIQSLNHLIANKMKQIENTLSNKQETTQEADDFELLLESDEFELLQTEEEKSKKEIKRKISQISAEIEVAFRKISQSTDANEN